MTAMKTPLPSAGCCETMVLSELVSVTTMTIDQLMVRLPQFTWPELFCALDAMSRRGDILMRRRGFEYELSVPGQYDRALADRS
jgi:hypothetical protein